MNFLYRLLGIHRRNNQRRRIPFLAERLRWFNGYSK